MQKARRHHFRAPTACRRTVSGTLSLFCFSAFSPFLTVLVAIGLSGVFSLTGWSRQIHAEFLVFRATQDTTMLRLASNTGLSPSVASLSRLFFSQEFLQRRGPTTPSMP